MRKSNPRPIERLAYSPEEAAIAAGYGMTKIYEAIKAGGLKARKAGTRTLITVADLNAWLDSLPLIEAA